jgi:hypothetical protein
MPLTSRYPTFNLNCQLKIYEKSLFNFRSITHPYRNRERIYAVATRTYGFAVWNDVRNATDCPAIDTYRASLRSGIPLPAPVPCQSPATTFGNSDIFGGP